MWGRRQWTVWAVMAAGLLCAGQVGAAPHVAVTPISTETSCAGVFVAQPLPHTVEPVPNLPMPFDSNGAGVAIADLDGDGWLDVVLGGLHGPATVLWNRGGPGGPAFDAVALELVGARAVAIVDVDGDGHQDIVATRTDERPRWLRGSGGRAFRIVDDEQFIARHPIYSMAWGDLDGDRDLDVVGATYDAELERYEAMEAYRNFVKTNVSSARTRQRGVWYYENLGPRDRRSPFEQGEFQFRAQRLAEGAMALAIVLTDVDGDALSDIVVGNDYDIPDNVFLRTPDPTRPHRSWWRPGSPFPVTTRNTMGFATGDVDNDGRIELFAVDMSPYRSGPDIDEAWGPLLQPGGAATPVGDGVQAAANVLQTRQEDGSYVDTAARSGSPPPAGAGRFSSGTWTTTATWTCTPSTAWSATRSANWRTPSWSSRTRRCATSVGGASWPLPNGGWAPPRAGAAWRSAISTATATWTSWSTTTGRRRCCSRTACAAARACRWT